MYLLVKFSTALMFWEKLSIKKLQKAVYTSMVYEAKENIFPTAFWKQSQNKTNVTVWGEGCYGWTKSIAIYILNFIVFNSLSSLHQVYTGIAPHP